MTIPISNWLLRRYAVLWKRHRNNKIGFKDVTETLKEKNDKRVTVILSELKKSGWICVERNKEDKRKGIYQLKSPEKIIDEIATNY